MARTGKGWIDVKTSRRSYSARGDARIPWERGEKVVSIEPHDDDDCERMSAAREERESRERQDRW
jgi:hypothetical protein